MTVYTKHAQDKLKRRDIIKFGITKKLIEKALKFSEEITRTKYGEYAVVMPLNQTHDLRVIYDIIAEGTKVITFHIAKKGRYLNINN